MLSIRYSKKCTGRFFVVMNRIVIYQGWLGDFHQTGLEVVIIYWLFFPVAISYMMYRFFSFHCVDLEVSLFRGGWMSLLRTLTTCWLIFWVSNLWILSWLWWCLWIRVWIFCFDDSHWCTPFQVYLMFLCVFWHAGVHGCAGLSLCFVQ